MEHKPNINVPDFVDLEDFAKWYVDNNMPYDPPRDSATVELDDATTTTMFRSGRFQVEMYFMKAKRSVPSHCHPAVEVIIANVSPKATRDKIAICEKMSPYEMHGENTFGDRAEAKVILSIQKWAEGIPMTSVSIQWLGYTAGDMHDESIRKFYPQALVKKGYCDIRLAFPDLDI